MQFFLANLYSERLSGAPVTAEEHTTVTAAERTTSSPATAAANNDARPTGAVLTSSR